VHFSVTCVGREGRMDLDLNMSMCSAEISNAR
jgi:hypothetical protein